MSAVGPRALALALGLLGAAAPAGAGAEGAEARAWEVGGVRLESEQVERLARDVARQTVVAVRRLDGLELRDAQAEALETVYREVALEVYGDAAEIVDRDALSVAEKERRVVARILDGQERSSRRVAEILDEEQYAVYRAWERRQVAAFERRGLGWTRRAEAGR